MTAENTIDYEALTQDAMRSVVRAVLIRAAKSGLPGDHHFYISFDTQAPGVMLSKRLKESPKYQSEMTIVLQHRFWDLAVSDERFEVKLTFDGIPERLVVPFTAVKVFFDPSVRYGLQFEDPDQAVDVTAEGAQGVDDGADMPAPAGARATTTRSQGPRKPRAPRKPRPDRDVAPATVAPPKPLPAAVQPAAPATPRGVPVQPVAASPAASDGDDKPAAPAASGAQILSLDQFRKK
jgi:hypothetical protein